MFFYLFSVLFFLFIGLLLEGAYHEHLFRHLKARMMWATVFLFIGILWDVHGLFRQYWVFPGSGILGWHIGIMPVEDFLWFFIIPYFCLTVYKTIQIILRKKV